MIKNAHTMHHLLAGELGQMAERFNLSQDFNDYLTNVKGKTAALFRLAAEEGSHFGNGDEQTLSLIHISEPTRRHHVSRMPSSA